jgi:hypothetical protein
VKDTGHLNLGTLKVNHLPISNILSITVFKTSKEMTGVEVTHLFKLLISHELLWQLKSLGAKCGT